MRIRKVADDHRDLDVLDKMCFPYDPPYKKAGAVWWIVRDEGETVAFAGLRDLGDGTGFLCRVGVVKGHRGRRLQRRLIKVRLAEARRMGLTHLVTYTSPCNLASANSLVHEGFSLYAPANPYAMAHALYFLMEL